MLQFAVDDMQVSAANAASAHLQQNLMLTGFRDRDVTQDQWRPFIPLERGLRLEQHCPHLRHSCARMASVTCRVVAVPPRSGVRRPEAVVASMARITLAASTVRPRLSSISAALQIAPIGLAMPWPAMSGAEPWTGSNMLG